MNNYIIEIPSFGVLDTYNNIDASFTYSFQDLSEMNSRVREFSKTIKLPHTNNNAKFFKHIFEDSISSTYNTNKSVECIVRIDSTQIFEGYLKLNKIVKDLEAPEYEISIVSITKNFMDSIGDKKLNTIDLSEYNHTRDKDTIQNSWETTIIRNNIPEAFELGKGYVYPKIAYGKSSDIENIYVYDTFPSTYVKTIFDKLFEQYGFTYSSNFLNTEYFNRLIIPFNKDKIELDDEQSRLRQAKAGILPTPDTMSWDSAFGQDFYRDMPYGNSTNAWKEVYSGDFISNGGLGFNDETNEDFNDEGNIFDGGEFTISHNGYYDVSLNASMVVEYTAPLVLPQSGDIEYVRGTLAYKGYLQRVRANGVVDNLDDTSTTLGGTAVQHFEPSDTNTHSIPWLDNNKELPLNLTRDNIYLEAGDKIRLLVGLNTEVSNSPETLFKYNNGTGVLMRATPKLKRNYNGNFNTFEVKLTDSSLMGGEEVNMSRILPDLKIKDFLGGIITMFNLTFNTNPDNPNDIIIEPTDEYLKSSNITKDWSKKLDRESYDLIPTSNITSKQYDFDYLKDEDYFNKLYFEGRDKIYGNLELTTENNFNVKTDKTKLPFASTPISNYFGNVGVSPYFLDLDSDSKFEPKAVKPRILFYGGMLDSNAYELRDGLDDDNPYPQTKYPYCGHLDNPLTPKYDLNFGSTDKVYYPTSNYTLNTLYNQFHRNMVESVISKDGRKLVGNFLLTPQDISTINPRDIIHIDGVNYRILEVKDYNPIAYDKLTKVELIKIIDFEKYSKSTNSVPTFANACPIDTTVDTNQGVLYSPSGGVITEVCCDEYGGVWQDGSCVVKNISGEGTTDGGAPTSEAVSIKTTTNLNSNDGNGVSINGSGNSVGNGANSGMILGNNNGLSQGKGSLIVGNDNSSNTNNTSLIVGNNSQIFPSEDNKTTIILGDGITLEDGVAQGGGNSVIALTSTPLIVVNMVEAGRDEVLNPFSTTKLVNVIDGGRDVVRGLGGDDMTMLVDAGRDKIK